jgi:hypothetical protein
MSRSNPTEASRNPCTRWFQFASGADGGFVRYYDKEAEKNIDLGDADSRAASSSFSCSMNWRRSAAGTTRAKAPSSQTKSATRGKTRSLSKASRAASSRQVCTQASRIASSRSAGTSFRPATSPTRMAMLCASGISDSRARPLVRGWSSRNSAAKKGRSGKSVKAYYVDAVKIDGFEQMKKGGHHLPRPEIRRSCRCRRKRTSKPGARCRTAGVSHRLPEAPARRSRTAASKTEETRICRQWPLRRHERRSAVDRR